MKKTKQDLIDDYVKAHPPLVQETGVLTTPQTITLPKLNGGEKVEVYLTDASSNKSEVLSVTVSDVTPPETPTVDPMVLDTESASLDITGDDGTTYMVMDRYGRT